MSDRHIDVPRLFRVWNNKRFTNEEVAAILRLTPTQLRRLAARYKLPQRYFVSRIEPEAEPDEAMVAEYERRKAECRERHMAERRAETERCTAANVRNWSRGVCQPRQGRHA